MRKPPPVDHTVNAPLAAPEAFDLFTRQVRKWWSLSSHSCAGMGWPRVLAGLAQVAR